MSHVAEQIVASIERYRSEPEKFCYAIYLAGKRLYSLRVEEINKVVKDDLKRLLDHLHASYPQFRRPILDGTEGIEMNKWKIVENYRQHWIKTYDITKIDGKHQATNFNEFLEYDRVLNKTVEEYLPKSLWKHVNKKYNEIDNLVAKQLESLTTEELNKAMKDINPLVMDTFDQNIVELPDIRKLMGM